ncbi:hypothetical protein [Pseudomonas phage HMGUpa2]|nr:hypothetical protein [Pseudomonas phage HMGUpa2]
MSDYKRINGIIKSIANRGAALDKLVQTTGMDILKHIDEHGEVSLACKLFNAMPQGSRRLALAHWFIDNGKIEANTDKEKAKEFPFVFAKDKATRLERAAEKPWFKYKKERDVADEFSLDQAIAAFKAKVQRAIDKGQLQAADERIAIIQRLEVKDEAKAA